MSKPQDLEILNRIAAALNRSATLSEALSATLEQAAFLLGLETGWIFLFRSEDGTPYLAASQNLPDGIASRPEVMDGTCYCLDTFQDGDMSGAANINTITCSRLKWLRETSRAGLRFHASIPLYAHGQEMGILNVASRDWRELTEGELRLLHTIGDMVGIAIERAQLYEQSLGKGRLEERNRLAREIHDTLAQDLAGITLQLETASALIDGSAAPQTVQACIETALNTLRNSLDDVQRSVMDLRAAPLEGRHLVDAVSDILTGLGGTYPGRIDLETSGSQQPLPPRVEIGLFRIAQEGLRNVVQHAAATEIRVTIRLSPENAYLLVEDNGLGFDPNHLSEGRFGLIGMKERTQLLNGHFKLETAPGEGTSIEVILPLE